MLQQINKEIPPIDWQRQEYLSRKIFEKGITLLGEIQEDLKLRLVNRIPRYMGVQIATCLAEAANFEYTTLEKLELCLRTLERFVVRDSKSCPV